jgi:hypothetical protein
MRCRGQISNGFTLVAVSWTLCACSSTTTTVSSREPKSPPGFFERLADQLTERECNVGRFICPYGLGLAGEPCECIGPGGVVFNGRTVK